MILIVLAALCIASVPLTGGRLLALGELRLRGLALPLVALALQVLVVTIAPGGNHDLHAGVHIATYAMIGMFLVANRHIAGMPVIAAGTASNALAIILNGGVMPAAVGAQRLAGLVESRQGFHNSAALGHPHLLWLGDVIPVPGPLPNVLSIGDCLIFLGLLVLLHQSSRQVSQPSASRRSATRSLGSSIPQLSRTRSEGTAAVEPSTD